MSSVEAIGDNGTIRYRCRLYCLNDFELIRDTAAELGIVITREGYERKFARWLPEWKPHLIRKDLPEWAQELIAKIEGTTLADIRRHQDKLQDQL